MSNRRIYLIIVLIGLMSSLGGILGNIASGVLPDTWQPYLWIAWPLFIVSVLALIGLLVWRARIEAAEKEEAPPPDPGTLPAPSPAPRTAPRPAASDDEYAYDVFISYSHRDEDWVTGVNNDIIVYQKRRLKSVPPS